MADDAGSSSSQVGLKPVDMMETIKWIFASLAGLTAFMALIGFLADAALMRVLGVDLPLGDKTLYTIVGATSLPISIVLVLLALGKGAGWIILGVTALLYWLCSGTARPPWLARLRNPALILTVLLILGGELSVIQRVGSADRLAGVLMVSEPLQGEIGRALETGDVEHLRAIYGALVLLTTCLGFLGRSLDRYALVGGAPQALWMRARLVAYPLLLVIVVAGLPSAYGVLCSSYKYPQVARIPTTDPERQTQLIRDIEAGGFEVRPVFQLRQVGDKVVIYSRGRRVLLTVERSQLGNYVLTEPRYIFTQ